MRQAQQNRRGRGRNNNNNNSGNRKGQNPLTRSFESNGPDVKIRGTPAHIAEKYVAMARDALTSGDPVLAENYLQHAEHYNRIIMMHREQQAPQNGDNAQSHQHPGGRQRISSDSFDDDGAGEDTGDEMDVAVPRGNEPQPSIRSHDRGDERPTRRHRRDRMGEREQRSQERGPDRDRDRDRDRARDAGPEREPRNVAEREGSDERDARSADRADAPTRERASGADKPRSTGRGGSRRSRYAQTDDQPEFLTRPVRRPRSVDTDSDDDAPAAAAAVVSKSDEAAE